MPPIRCPLVPAPTGKLIIWTAKTKTDVSPASGAPASASSVRLRCIARPDGAGGHGAGRDRGGQVQEAVRYVHGAILGLLRLDRN